ncbi:MAG: Hpt domain-containing protein [Planctomycetales bacterium]|nr:Hpt domain-containing protein [Planctomycetales bacterium]
MSTAHSNSPTAQSSDGNRGSESADDRHWAADQPPPIDVDMLLFHCMGDDEFALSLLAELEVSGQQHLEKIEVLTAAQRATDTAAVAHALKGAAAIIGAEPLRGLAAQLQSMGESQELQAVATLVDKLRIEMARCVTHIGIIREVLRPAAR